MICTVEKSEKYEKATAINRTRLDWLLEGMRASMEGLVEADNPHSPDRGEAFDWWLFGWAYSELEITERHAAQNN